MELIQTMIKERQAKAEARGILQKAALVLSVYGNVTSSPDDNLKIEHFSDYCLHIVSSRLVTGELCEFKVSFYEREVFHQYANDVSSYVEGVWDRLLDLVAARAEHTKQLKAIAEQEDQLRKDIDVMKNELEKWGI